MLTYTTYERAYKLLYTGDFFLSNSRLVEGFRLEELRGIELDVLIVEGSYGTARHPHRRNQENQLSRKNKSGDREWFFSINAYPSIRIRSRITNASPQPPSTLPAGI